MKRLTICIASCLVALILVGLVSAEFSVTLSDEFNDATSFSDWTLGPAPAETWLTMDIDTSSPGRLVMVPSNINHNLQTSNNGWYAGSRGPYLYKMISGDFIATAYITSGNVADHSAPPTGSYNSSGFVARDPASGAGSENWVMYNHGAQVFDSGAGHRLATEAKTTVNSTSVLTLRPTGSATTNAGRLTLCRSGDIFHMFKWMEDESGWTLEESASRPDMPDTLQVGLVVNGWTNPNLYAEFDYVRIYTGTVANSAECLEQMSAPLSVSVVGNSAESRTNPIFALTIFSALMIVIILWKTRLNHVN